MFTLALLTSGVVFIVGRAPASPMFRQVLIGAAFVTATLAFFFLSAILERATHVGGGLCYPSLGSLILAALLTWAGLFSIHWLAVGWGFPGFGLLISALLAPPVYLGLLSLPQRLWSPRDPSPDPETSELSEEGA